MAQLRRRSARWATPCRPRWAPRSATPDARVWAIDGDGCFQMTNQELATCAHRGHPDQGRGHQQLQPRHGAAVADAVLRGPLLQHRPRHRLEDRAAHPRLRQAGRGDGLRRAALREPRTTSTRRSRRRWRSTTRRSSSTSWSTATRWCGRWSPPAPATTTSRSPATSRPSGIEEDVLMSHAHAVGAGREQARCAGPGRRLFSRRGFNIESLAVGPTEHPEVSRMTIVVNLEDQPLEQVTKQLNKLVNVLKIVELEPTAAVAARAAAGQGQGRRARPAARCSRPCSCSAPRSSTSPPTPSRSRRPATATSSTPCCACSSRSASASWSSRAWSRSAAAAARSPTARSPRRRSRRAAPA